MPGFPTRYALKFDTLAQPAFENDCCYFNATLDGKPMRVGVTHGALMLLMDQKVDRRPLTFLDALHPGLERARTVIQRKFADQGLDDHGKVLVTEQDVTLRDLRH